MLDWHIGLPGAYCCAGRQYRWRAGLGNASLSVGLKRLIYSLKYRAKRPGQSGVRRKGERRVEQRRDRGSLDMREGPLVSGPQPSLPLHPALLPFLPVTYLSRAARSHYRSVRKAAGRVASPSARVTDCRSALAAEEVRSGKVIGSDGQEVGTEGWRRRWRRAESQGEDDKTRLRDLWYCASYLKGHRPCF